jgi:hypothetical protein
MENIKIWKLHPTACRVEKAEKTCMGTANSGALRWCGPYTNANKYGFWIYPPIDFNFIYKDGKFEHEYLEEYGNDDYKIIRSLIKPCDNSKPDKWLPEEGRTKFTWGAVEPNVVQIWTGLIFQTPPGWCLHIRSPINFQYTKYHVMEAILETDWMQYDIWINLVCDQENEKFHINKKTPLAQILPVRRESYEEKCEIQEENINRNSKESNKVFEYYLHYNKKKFENGGKQFMTPSGSLTKDSGTYYKEKSRILDKEMEPKCPFQQSKNFIGKLLSKKIPPPG